jgi:hypothetical protein
MGSRASSRNTVQPISNIRLIVDNDQQSNLIDYFFRLVTFPLKFKFNFKILYFVFMLRVVVRSSEINWEEICDCLLAVIFYHFAGIQKNKQLKYSIRL